MRAALNLTVAKTWSDITSNTVAAAALKALYGDIDTVDAVVGGLAEDAENTEPNNVLGPLFRSALKYACTYANSPEVLLWYVLAVVHCNLRSHIYRDTLHASCADKAIAAAN
jgi:Animal haem peroxidase